MKPVVTLATGRVTSRDETIKILEHLLENARSGEIQEVVVVAVQADGDLSFDWSSLFDKHKILGAISVLQYRILHHCER